MNKNKKIFCGVIGILAVICCFIILSTVNEYANETLENESSCITTIRVPKETIACTTAAATTTTIITTTSVAATTESFYALNEDSMRVHRNNCEYYDDSMEVINGDSIECGRLCEKCKPEVQIETIYEEPTENFIYEEEEEEENIAEEEENTVEEEEETISYSSSYESFTGTFFGCVDRDGNSTGMGTHGAGNMELIDQYSIALNDNQRQALGLEYGDEVYIECPDIPELTGTYVIADCGCGWGIIDVFWYDYNSIPDYIYSMGVFSMNLYY